MHNDSAFQKTKSQKYHQSLQDKKEPKKIVSEWTPGNAEILKPMIK